MTDDDMAAESAASAGAFHAAMTKFEPLPTDHRMAVAVSGGPDSMALAILAARWCRERGYPAPHALIVDHRLRPDSGAEAETVRSRLAAIGLTADILTWEHATIAARVHSTARMARYRLLIEACRARGIACLLVGHHREDQAETILMRLAKGTGLDGLAGIPADATKDGVRVIRPFLDWPKENLVALCEAAGIATVIDPSNEQTKYARGRLRRVMPLLAEEGLTIERMLHFGARAGEAKEALDYYATELLNTACRQDEWGTVTLDKAPMQKAPRAIALRVLETVLQAVHAVPYPLPHAALSSLWDAVAHAPTMPPRTLSGSLVRADASIITVLREQGAIAETQTIRAGETVMWDGRWRVSLAQEAGLAAYEVRSLGNPPHDVLDRLCPDLRRRVPQGRVRATLPALWLEGEISIIPFGAEKAVATARLTQKFLK